MKRCPSAVFALLATLAAMPALTGGRAASGAPGGPAFLPRQRTTVLARVGDSVELSCRVLHLADRTVSWVRSRDLQILTHAGTVFTADARVSCAESVVAPPVQQPQGSTTLHALRIARLRANDAGRYECQVNTEPKMSLFFNLTVVEGALPRVVVQAAHGAVKGVRGGAVRLACGAHYEPPDAAAPPDALPPLRISWQHAGRDVDPQSERGGVSLDSERWAGGASSRLTLGALVMADAGRYTCRAGPASATVTLHVTEVGDRDYAELEDAVGQMQRDEAMARASPASRAAASGRALLLALVALAALSAS